jgi:hypothetical protein
MKVIESIYFLMNYKEDYENLKEVPTLVRLPL